MLDVLFSVADLCILVHYSKISGSCCIWIFVWRLHMEIPKIVGHELETITRNQHISYTYLAPDSYFRGLPSSSAGMFADVRLVLSGHLTDHFLICSSTPALSRARPLSVLVFNFGSP
jgi:hypothetical protein